MAKIAITNRTKKIFQMQPSSRRTRILGLTLIGQKDAEVSGGGRFFI
jgi:hypothetical protein